MSDTNTAILQAANAAVTAGDNETFLSHCAHDIVWSTVGGETLRGKDAVRQWMAETYTTPPAFNVRTLLADGDHVVALGDITADTPAANPSSTPIATSGASATARWSSSGRSSFPSADVGGVQIRYLALMSPKYCPKIGGCPWFSGSACAVLAVEEIRGQTRRV